MSDLLERLKKHIELITPEEFDKEIEEIEKLQGDGVTILDDSYTYDERDFIGEAERNRAIHFAKWISCYYSFGNISGLWYFHENTSKQYTEEELYELYLEQLKKGEI